MTLLKDAWNALKRNYRLALVFILAISAINMGYEALALALQTGIDEESPAFGAFRILFDIVIVALYSAVYAVFFARMGKDMDRPIWKCSDDKEALRRYFEPWFILNLIGLALLRLAGRADSAGQAELVATLVAAWALYTVAIIPLGASVMYAGGLNWRNLGEILAPIGRQFGQVLLVFAIGFLQIIVYITGIQLTGEEPSAFDPRILGLEVLITALDIFAFAVMWRILIVDRDTPRDDADFFDF